jgi:hypothetical protein
MTNWEEDIDKRSSIWLAIEDGNDVDDDLIKRELSGMPSAAMETFFKLFEARIRRCIRTWIRPSWC